MSLRDEVKDWLKEGKEIKAKNPLCSKRLVVDNLWEVLIENIENTDKLDAGRI